MSHSHYFAAWPFEEPIDAAVFSTRQVLSNSSPILEVYHDHDGDWQFLCGTTQEAADLKVVCLGCMLERDSTLASLADLPIGWVASRREHAEAWTREPYEAREGDDQ